MSTNLLCGLCALWQSQHITKQSPAHSLLIVTIIYYWAGAGEGKVGPTVPPPLYHYWLLCGSTLKYEICLRPKSPMSGYKLGLIPIWPTFMLNWVKNLKVLILDLTDIFPKLSKWKCQKKFSFRSRIKKGFNELKPNKLLFHLMFTCIKIIITTIFIYMVDLGI